MNDSPSIDGRTMGTDREYAPRQAWRSRAVRKGQSTFRGCDRLNCAHRNALARPPTLLRQLEQRVEALSSVGESRCVGTHPGCAGRRSRLGIGHHRWNNHPGAPTCGRRKRGIQEQAIGRSRGGLSTKIHIAVVVRLPWCVSTRRVFLLDGAHCAEMELGTTVVRG